MTNSNAQSLAAAEVRAAHRLQCLDACRAAGLPVTVDDVDAVMEGRSSEEVVRILRRPFLGADSVMLEDIP